MHQLELTHTSELGQYSAAVHSSCTLFHAPLLLVVDNLEMAHFSDVIINGGSFNSYSAQGDLHIHSKDALAESGMHNLRSG